MKKSDETELNAVVFDLSKLIEKAYDLEFHLESDHKMQDRVSGAIAKLVDANKILATVKQLNP